MQYTRRRTLWALHYALCALHYEAFCCEEKAKRRRPTCASSSSGHVRDIDSQDRSAAEGAAATLRDGRQSGKTTRRRQRQPSCGFYVFFLFFLLFFFLLFPLKTKK